MPVLPDVVRFVGGIGWEEGEKFFKTNVKRLAKRFQTPDALGRDLGLEIATRHDAAARLRESDPAAHKTNSQVTFQRTLAFLDCKIHLSADRCFQECGSIIAHGWRLMAGGRPYYVKHYNMRFIERQAFSLTLT